MNMVWVIGGVVFGYLIGSIPFGYLVARWHGIDIFREGSGNIGATNVGRVLGRKYGIFVFLLDFAKGAVPVGMAAPLVHALTGERMPVLPVAVACATFLGHLFPIYLGLRGGKGIATGAGTVVALVPGPALLALLVWLTLTVCTRTISIASLFATLTLAIGQILTTSAPFAYEELPLTLYCWCGSVLVFVKHRANLQRLWNGTENRLTDTDMLRTTAKALHLLALSLWLGSAVFFNFLAAPTIFATFREVVATAPNDRTAFHPLLHDVPDRDKAERELASALAGAAVGPVFPLFFALQGICAVIALLTAFSWIQTRPGIIWHRLRVAVIMLAAATVAVGWPIAKKVTELRLARFSPDLAVAQAAQAAFGSWHLLSLALSFATCGLVFLAVLLAARLPETPQIVQLFPPPRNPTTR